VFLCGFPPFIGDSDAQILKAVEKGVYDFSADEWTAVSKSAIDLVRSMLQPQDKRFTVEKILGHEWMK